MKITNVILEDSKQGISVGKREVLELLFEDMQGLIWNTVYSLVKLFQDNCMSAETTDISKDNKYKIKIIDYLSWVNKMKIVLEPN